MSQIALYKVLVSLGADEKEATEAAQLSDLVTKDYLKGELEALRNSLLIWTFSMLFGYWGATIGVMFAVIKWLKP